MMAKHLYKKFFNIIFSSLFFLLILLNQNVVSKPIPPGSGEGDVPANILILLDSSASMRTKIIAGDGIENPGDVVEIADGNLIIGEGKLGFAKILTATKKVDSTFAGDKRNFRGSNTDTCSIGGTKDSSVGFLNDLGVATNLHSTYTNAGVTEIIYGADSRSDNGKIVGITPTGTCVEVISYSNLGGFRPHAMEVRTIGGEDHIFASGKVWSGGWKNRFYTKNLTTNESTTCDGDYSGNLGTYINRGTDLTVDRQGNHIYYIYALQVYGFELTKTGNNYCPTDETWDRRYTRANSGNKVRPTVGIDMARDADDIMYLISRNRYLVQKVQLLTDTTVTSIATAGRKKRASNTADAGALNANEVNFWRPNALFVSATKVYVSDLKASIQEFDIDDFTSSGINDSWQAQYGGAKLNRYQGAKKAITTIVTDSSLTSGANFGYGHWNSGESGKGKKSKKGGWQCHAKLDDCDYYQGWSTTTTSTTTTIEVGTDDDGNPILAFGADGSKHPEGQSKLCNRDSCLLVGVGPKGYTDIPAALNRYGLAWGTDANAFAQMADEYFRSTREKDGFQLVDTAAPCQLNYVIVIGDGAWRHHSQAYAMIEALRLEKGVQTIVVAYGGGISGGALENFKSMAIAGSGSCTDDDGNEVGCHRLIEASTPQKLKTELQSKIQQIIADRLSFTAPSITATIQEGGSIYQAQFNYEQHGEWQGTILRKAITDEGVVEHGENYSDENGSNWDAADKLSNRTNPRNIWTVLGDSDSTHYYDAGWNNWTTTDDKYLDAISDLFEELDNEVLDYHNTSSTCYDRNKSLEDGTDDDISGLIDFVRGKDYFDYDGDCVITEDRPHMLGDIYHSQLVEVGIPSANQNFTNINQEAYWRVKNNYSSFVNSKSTRKKVIYAGANDGMLHAFDASNGEEEWGFVPPFIIGRLPIIVNTNLDGKVNGTNGGTNAIFGVDGSPVIHDMYIRGLSEDGKSWNAGKSWRTILMIPYGRGGAGFSVLDITNPIIKDKKGPLHMFSVFNDAVNNQVKIANHIGEIKNYPYERGAISLSRSEEAIRAAANNTKARDDDATAVGNDADGNQIDCEETDACAEQDAIVSCQTNANADSGQFYIDGENACFKGTKFTFNNLPVAADSDGTVSIDSLIVTETQDSGDDALIAIQSAKFIGTRLEVTFHNEKIFNASTSDDSTEVSSRINLQVSCDGSGTADVHYDYSQLGETWSAPRIFRMPSMTGDTNIDDDTYVAVMGGGMGNTFICSGSNLFIVDLESGSYNAGALSEATVRSSDDDDAAVATPGPGSLYGWEENNGPINIIDTDPTGVNPGLSDSVETEFGSDIANAVPASPVVITPDVAKGIQWTGALVYVNDLEGKITKINLTNQTKPDTIEQAEYELYEQTTLFHIDASVSNDRYSYHSMDATIGKDTNDFWLFGGTGNFERIGSTGNESGDWMQNILYGVKDRDYPFFRRLNGENSPIKYSSSDGFPKREAHIAANNAKSIENNNTATVKCTVDTTLQGPHSGCKVTRKNDAWVIYLDQPDGEPLIKTANKFRKVSAAPTVYKGQVYFPIYEPDKDTKCGLGRALVCSADDECGNNNSVLIANEDHSFIAGDDCLFIRRGILSELVIFGDTLYANIAGPSDTEHTLISIKAAAGDVTSYRKSWRENF